MLADRWFGRIGKMDLGPRYSEELRLFLLSEALTKVLSQAERDVVFSITSQEGNTSV